MTEAGEDLLVIEQVKDSAKRIGEQIKSSAVDFLEECLVSGISEENIIRIMRIGEKSIQTDIIQIHLGACEAEWTEYAILLAEKFKSPEYKLYIKDLIKVIKSIAVDNKHEIEDYKAFLYDLLNSSGEAVLDISKLMSIRNNLERTKVSAADLSALQLQITEAYKSIIANVTEHNKLQQQVYELQEENKRLKNRIEASKKEKNYFKGNKNVTKMDLIDNMIAQDWDVEKIDIVKGALEAGIDEQQMMSIILREPNTNYLMALVDVVLAGKNRNKGEC